MPKTSPKTKIALLAGGVSGEREISLKTGEEIYRALDKNKYEIARYDPKTDLRRFFIDAIDGKFDLVFPALHGPFGEDGKLQGMLDILGVPYVFSGTLASALAMDKYKTKIMARNLNIRIPKDIVLTKASVTQHIDDSERYDLGDIIETLSLPVVIKPNGSGSSLGITIANDKSELKKGIRRAFSHDKDILLEQRVRGRELTVAVIGCGGNAEALPIIEIVPKISAWFDYRAKYEAGGSEEICPARIPKKIERKVRDLSLRVYAAIGCKDAARADFIWEEETGFVYFLEINTIPGMTAESLVPKAARAAGMTFSQFLDKLIEGALI